jgi:nucleotide-binding universal stress UspA family protein
MYKHILVATDGSELSARAIVEAVKLAKCSGAKVTGLHVAPQYMPTYYGETAMTAPVRNVAWCPPRDQYEAEATKEGTACLSVVEREAAKSAIPVSTVMEFCDSPSQAILNTAEKLHCDCIVMASHGRRGLSGLLIGSETHKVLTLGKRPVLVVR